MLPQPTHYSLSSEQNPSDSYLTFGRVLFCTALIAAALLNTPIIQAQPSAPDTTHWTRNPHIVATPDTLPRRYNSNAAPYLIVKKISLKGNKRTKDRIILRELDFRVGDTLQIADLEAIFKKNRNQVYNTSLFNDVAVRIAAWRNKEAELLISVEERWYIFPVPIFQLTDRNFNDWWVTHQRDLRRTEYGFQFIHYNFRGRREKLKILFQLGYTQKFELNYQVPFLDRQGKTGISFSGNYITNREVAWRTFGNRQEFYRDTLENLRSRFRVGASITHRPNVQESHNLGINYTINHIKDYVAQINPDYFLDGRSRQAYPHFNYTYTADYRDIRPYPLHGYFFRLNFNKLGLSSSSDINMMSLWMGYTHYFQLGKRWYGLANAHGRISFPERQPYYNQQGLGYGTSYLRGYEYYVIDGQYFGLLRTALKYELLNVKFKNPLLKGDQFRTLPLAIYLKTYLETAYVKDAYYAANNPLSNKWLGACGLGIDIFSVYDMVLSLEYSFNAERESGFFVSFRTNYD